ncbi:hypothetical protein DL766_005085 [Monosporascus sp. MC13-8B]|uniref:NAD-dependent epimerase/dehydratase domain-containing protein n=1 Tax=Monosporascus cannonballus TaxID=155416 RepID=A0ABY0HJD8_9PEZI|nr:hypothetical protein DL762_000879 [Monosporascus cannonballus]RYP30008.1 hypothetical protein DL766_005085 [Monosporascus sp. MC13-8B]
MAPKGTILITGLNGYLAGRVAEAVLEAGYRVRGTVRRLATGLRVQAALIELGYNKDLVEVIQVSDITQPRAFDEAALGCTAIIHAASPTDVSGTTDAAEVVRRAVSSTIAVLHSAEKAGPQLQSVVYMSSSAAIFNTPPEAKVHTERDWNTTSEVLVDKLGSEAGALVGYAASKTAAERAFWEFRDKQKPGFALAAVQASLVWKIVAGEDIPDPLPIYDATIDVRDVARVLVWAALHPKEADGERYMCSGATGGAQAIADILNKHMPDLQVKRGNPGKGYKPDYADPEGVTAFDCSKAVEATGQG